MWFKKKTAMKSRIKNSELNALSNTEPRKKLNANLNKLTISKTLTGINEIYNPIRTHKRYRPRGKMVLKKLLQNQTVK